jgi:hypothetical protein
MPTRRAGLGVAADRVGVPAEHATGAAAPAPITTTTAPITIMLGTPGISSPVATGLSA